MQTIVQMIGEAGGLNKEVQKLSPQIEKAAKAVEAALKNGNKVILAGNGGSASEATHIAAEFTGRYKKERRSLPSISLATDLSAITAIANDYGYEWVFSRQLEGLGSKGDVFIALSTSGNSENLIEALRTAKKMGIRTVSLLGKDGGRMEGMANMEIIIPSQNTPRIQEYHLMILHIICEVVEGRMFK